MPLHGRDAEGFARKDNRPHPECRMIPDVEPSTLLEIAEVATQLECSRSWADRLVRAKRLRVAVRTKRLRLFDPADVARLKAELGGAL